MGIEVFSPQVRLFEFVVEDRNSLRTQLCCNALNIFPVFTSKRKCHVVLVLYWAILGGLATHSCFVFQGDSLSLGSHFISPSNRTYFRWRISRVRVSGSWPC